MMRTSATLISSPVETANSMYRCVFGLDDCRLRMGVTLRLLVEIMLKKRLFGFPFPNSDRNASDTENCENTKNPFHPYKLGAVASPFKIGAFPC